MIDNIQEFYQIGREVICNELQSNDCSPEQLKIAIDFIVNEASNYQILSLLIDENLPQEKENIQHESILIESLNNINEAEFITLTEDKKKVENAKTVYDKLKDKLSKLNDRLTKTRGWDTSEARAERHIVGKEMDKLHGQLRKARNNYYDLVKHHKNTQMIKAVGGLALAATIAYGAYKIYKNYLSKAARSCAGKPDKSACMQQYKNNALKAQITKLKADSGKCSKSKDPDKCKASIQAKINKLQSKIS